MTGVLLMAYGAAGSLAEVPAYLAHIRQGRPPDSALIEEVTRRYRLMGGRSPLPGICAAQSEALGAKLGAGFKVAFGMRHSEPWIVDVLGSLARSGCEAVVGLPLTPFASKLSTGAYFSKFEEGAARHRAKTLRAASFHDHPRLIEGLAEHASAALARLKGEGGGVPRVLFTAHSLPSRIEAEGDPYSKQLRETAALVAERLGLDSYEFAYQSSGRTSETWLGPDAGAVLERLAAEGARAIVLAPIGFVSEHLETLYDVDVTHREQASKLGMRFERAAALNDHPGLIDALADSVRAALAVK